MNILCRIGLHRWKHGTCRITEYADKPIGMKDTAFDFRSCKRCGLAQEKKPDGRYRTHEMLTKICRIKPTKIS